jgi:nucleoside-diphosphate-sugar epimerase
MINLYGCGFIGGEYVKKYPCVVNTRNELEPKTNEVLYFISTIDNYNVLTNSTIDIETNLILLMNVLDSCRNKYGNDFTFNFISSWFVYGDCELPARETSHCSPKGFYSITKKAAEDLLICYCKTFGIKYRILRLCNVLGKADEKVSKKKNALQYILERLKTNQQIDLYDSGKFYRDYMYVEDVVDAINIAVTDGDINQIYNIGSGEMVEFCEIIEYAKDVLKSQSKLFSIEPTEFHSIVQTKNMILDPTKINSLSFKPKYDTYQKIIDKLLQDDIE